MDSASAGAQWKSYVLQDGHTIIGPTQQRICEGADVWDGNELSQKSIECIQVLLETGDSGRRWTLLDGRRGAMFLCGEVNLVGGKGRSGCYWRDEVASNGLTEKSLAEFEIIVNPAHTPTTLPAMRDKRVWLSRGKLLLLTANIYAGDWYDTSYGRRGKAAHKAACVWSRGKPRELRVEHRADNWFCLKTIEIPEVDS